jgi:hypothetical protein
VRLLKPAPYYASDLEICHRLCGRKSGAGAMPAFRARMQSGKLRMRKRAKIDANQPEIVAALRRIGCSVQSLANIGGGCPDILVGYRGLNHILEIKDGTLPPSRRGLTLDEYKWHEEWQGKVHCATCVDDAIWIVTGRYPKL